MRAFYIILGCIAVVLGTIGIFVPGLPTTPFVLLASWCFYRSSPRLQAWLLQSFLGKYIREYRDKGGLPLRKAHIYYSTDGYDGSYFYYLLYKNTTHPNHRLGSGCNRLRRRRLCCAES